VITHMSGGLILHVEAAEKKSTCLIMLSLKKTKVLPIDLKKQPIAL